MIKKYGWVGLAALFSLATAGLGISQVLLGRAPEGARTALPFLAGGSYPWRASLKLVLNFLFLLISINLLLRKRVAWAIAFVMAVGVLAVQIIKVHFAPSFILPLATIGLLIASRKKFTVRSDPASISQGLGMVGASLFAALTYGTLGFWLLDKREFGIEFHFIDSFARSLREYTLIGNSDIWPHTRYARWFLDSLHILGITAVVFAVLSLFRPLTYQIATLPAEREKMRRILSKFGKTALDTFKLWPDKSYFFSSNQQAAVAYRTSFGVAITLGDPVGPPELLKELIQQFISFSSDNGWGTAFYQVLPKMLPAYESFGFRTLKIGEEAIIDLATFASRTSLKREFRNVENKFSAEGYAVVRYTPPHGTELLNEIESVSKAWLTIPGRHEGSFSLGHFDRSYLRETPLYGVRDDADKMIAFANQLPSYRESEVTADLMRYTPSAPRGTMDFLFLSMLRSLQEEFRTFSLGLAPLARVADHPNASREEKAVNLLYKHLDRFFSFKGLRTYKEKFEPTWEDRYSAYSGGTAGLIKSTIALSRVGKEEGLSRDEGPADGGSAEFDLQSDP